MEWTPSITIVIIVTRSLAIAYSEDNCILQMFYFFYQHAFSSVCHRHFQNLSA